MGISSANFALLEIVEGSFDGWCGVYVLDLGNQIMRDFPGRMTAKHYFTVKGAIHRSFDLNEEDGAIPVDLCKPVPSTYWDYFDLVTNFGTSEHIKNQVQVFRTMHDCCRTGGYLLHSIPLVGSWRGHSPYHYREGFGTKLAEVCYYSVVSNSISDRNGNKLLNVLLQKKETSVFSDELFPWGEVEKTSDYQRGPNNRW